MLNGVSAFQYNPYQAYGAYNSSAAYSAASARGMSVRTIPAAQPEVPVTAVTPVRPVPAVQSGPLNKADLLLRLENDPAAMAVRGRSQYAAGGQAAAEAEDLGAEEAESPQETAEEAECQTCKERKYQDGSDDPGVSFKTPGHIDPNRAAAVVRGHEQEHVVREQAKALREDREVVSQTVTLHTGICPECGRTYVSGGTTRTVTRAAQDNAPVEADGGKQSEAA